MTASSGTATRQIALNNNAGEWVEIDATIVSRFAEAIEDYVATGGAVQGLEYQLPVLVDDTVTWTGPIIGVAPEQEPVEFGDKKALHMPSGPILAQPGQPIIGVGTTAAFPICRMRSASAMATTVNFTEYQ